MEDVRARQRDRRKRVIPAVIHIHVITICLFATFANAVEAPKPTIAVFPLAGSAIDAAREKVGFALRSKINRDGAFDAIDGPTMSDLSGGPVALAATPDAMQKMLGDQKPAVLIWGELDGDDVLTLKLKILDLREPSPQPREIDKTISEPTQLRFAIENILQTIPGVKPFEHPSESGVTDDPIAAALWKSNANLLEEGNFADPSKWTVLYRSQVYPPPISDTLPQMDRVVIYRLPAENPSEKSRNVLAMRLSLDAAQSNGMACISQAFPVQPNRRYRMSFRYKSDGPMLHVFVKGYFTGPGITGQPTPIEDYRRQVPPSGPTHGKWVTIIDDMNPQNVNHPVETLRVDLYAYSSAGLVMFDDVVVKDVGAQTLHAKDDALRPSTQP